MPGVVRFVPLIALVHIALFGAGLFLVNAQSEIPDYGGPSGFLPSTGDSTHAYDRFSAWLSGSDRQQLTEPGDQGGIEILGWIIKGPMCGAVSMVKVLITVTVLKYQVVDLVPSDGFGLWFKNVVHVVAFLIHLALLSALVAFAIRAGIFSNPHIMVALGVISAFGIISTLLNAGGVFSCG